MVLRKATSISRIGVNNVDEPARGAIGDNNDVFDAPEKRKPENGSDCQF